MIEFIVGAVVGVGGGVAGAYIHARAWGGRFLKQRKLPVPPQDHGMFTRPPEEVKRAADEAGAWLDERGIPPVTHGGRMDFDPKELRGKGNSFQA